MQGKDSLQQLFHFATVSTSIASVSLCVTATVATPTADHADKWAKLQTDFPLFLEGMHLALSP